MESDEEKGRLLDLSRQALKKVPKVEDVQNVRVLILDDNELQKIDNIDSYLRIERLSLARNQLLRMYGVCRLQNLRELDLSSNGILTIEGLKELQQLVRLNLMGNNIKTIEHLSTNHRLQYLNLDDNSIANIADLSYLQQLRELHLNGNRLSHLKQCDKYLPVQLQVLDVGRNNLSDLNEICTLSQLTNLTALTVAENPCVTMMGATGFDYRPFVLNWCMTVKLIDGYAVTAIESLKAEWLYSQGKGRQFRVGEQEALARYLATCCPLSGEALEGDGERKLRLILSKAQQHQKQLQEETLHPDSSPVVVRHQAPAMLQSTPSPSSGRRKGVTAKMQSPRFQSRIGVRQGSPDAMVNSYHGGSSAMTESPMTNSFQMSTSLIENIKRPTDVMSQSLDPHVLSNNFKNGNENGMQQVQHALTAASKMMPVPESLMSPDCGPAATQQQLLHQAKALRSAAINRRVPALVGSTPLSSISSPKLSRNTQVALPPRKGASPPITSPRKLHSRLQNSNMVAHRLNSDGCSSDDENEQINVDKLKTIRDKAVQKVQEQQNHTKCVAAIDHERKSAVMIQKMWRGYQTRLQTRDMVEQIQKQRTQEYIQKLTSDMEVTKEALENERKIQQLQMQAINALWKKVSAMQVHEQQNDVPANGGGCAKQKSGGGELNNFQVVQDLTETCSMLTDQVQQLQGSMRDILEYVTKFTGNSGGAGGGGAAAVITNATKLNQSSEECQTEIVAVHTPQVEQLPFPFQPNLTSGGASGGTLKRPCTLPLDRNQVIEDAKAEEASEENLQKMVKETEVGGVEGQLVVSSSS